MPIRTRQRFSEQGPRVTPAVSSSAGFLIRQLWLVLMILFVGGAGLAVVLTGGAEDFFGLAGADLQVFGEVPDFTLVERDGQVLNKDYLLGKVWVANFIFTRCTTECPVLSSRMAYLQEMFAAETELRLVSISVDPEHDTPAVLTQYANSFKAHPRRWLFLTGEKVAVQRLVRDGFYLGLQELPQPVQSSMQNSIWRQHSMAWFPGFTTLLPFGPTVALAHQEGQHTPAGSEPAIVHSGRFVLVDRRGQIRFYCDSNDENAWRRLPRAVKSLLRSSAL